MKTNLVLFFDMDGVLANFNKAVCETFGHDHKVVIENWSDDWAICSQLGITKGQMWKKIDAIHDWWEHIPPHDWLKSLLNLADRYESYILSAPHITPSCASGKIAWLNKHTKFNGRVILTKHKYLCAAPNRVLIDDNDLKCKEFKEAGGHVILFPQVWNSNRQFADDPITYVFNELERIENETKRLF